MWYSATDTVVFVPVVVVVSVVVVVVGVVVVVVAHGVVVGSETTIKIVFAYE